jgi:hypothetical protein
MSAKPKISVVAATRNDNHGGDLNRRMQLFVDGLFEHTERLSFSIEIILVDWNPPDDKGPLAEALNWDRQGDYCTVKIVEVPREIHSLYNHADKLPMLQMIAKNAGIRRAAGDFILATNVDIIFSNEIMEYMANTELEPDTLYRAVRVDVDNKIREGAALDEVLLYCEENIIRRNLRHYSENVVTKQKTPIYIKNDIKFCEKNRLDNVLFTNACGDFQMMARENWFEIKGYPEFDMYSMNIDSVFAYMAYHSGIKERVIGDIYHMEHHSGFRPEDTESIDDRMKKRGIFSLTYKQFFVFPIRMAADEISPVINTDKWGFGGLPLNETAISGKNIVLPEIWETNFNFNPKTVCDTDYWIDYINRAMQQAECEKPFLSFLTKPMFYNKVRLTGRFLIRLGLGRFVHFFHGVITAVSSSTLSPFRSYSVMLNKKK